jgi:hypothetical protein
MGPIGCPERSVINYLYLLRNNPEERSSQRFGVFMHISLLCRRAVDLHNRLICRHNIDCVYTDEHRKTISVVLAKHRTAP